VIPHSREIPNLVGTNVADASSELTSLGFVVEQAKGQYDPDVPKDAVLAVDPPAGTSLKEGETVTLVPSLGPPPVAVPDVTGETLDQATADLRTAGLERGSVTQVFSEKVDEGRVVRQDPAGDQAPKGSPVDLWVSKGHAPVAVPGVVGKSQDRAEKILRKAGFVPVVQVAFSDEIARGLVIKVDPAEATPTPYGDPVTITVSQGPEQFQVPSFSGLTASEAQAKAHDYGLRLTFFNIPGTSATHVISQTPTTGSIVHAGDAIELFMA
jgi:eukaryotic-like serine/threonine-protein kinase